MKAQAESGHGRIAQLVEQLTLNQRVLGSSPSASTKKARPPNNLQHNGLRCFGRGRCCAFGRSPSMMGRNRLDREGGGELRHGQGEVGGGPRRRGKNGRASCRERVCQYG